MGSTKCTYHKEKVLLVTTLFFGNFISVQGPLTESLFNQPITQMSVQGYIFLVSILKLNLNVSYKTSFVYMRKQVFLKKPS